MADTEQATGGDVDLPVDLAVPRTDPWEHVEIAPDWRDVAAIARAVDGQLELLASRVAETVRAEVPGYGPPAPVPDQDFHASVINTMRVLLIGLAEQRRPTAAELEIRRELGNRRALQGLPVDAVLAAYQVGYRELWMALVEQVPPDAPITTRKLLAAATTVWGAVQEISDAIAATHAGTSRRLEARRIGARQRFVELLALDEVATPEGERLARDLGFDPGGPFRVTLLTTPGDEHSDPVDLQRHLDDQPGRHAVVARGSRQLVIAQRGETEAVVSAARGLLPEVTAASGAERAGLVGAAASLADAELTLDVTAPGGTSHFEDDWMWATLTGSHRRLAEVLRAGTDCAGSHPHLALAVTAYADHGFSVTDAARHLSLHANTVKYRLDRWEELTGWDPRTFTGLVRSLTAIRLG